MSTETFLLKPELYYTKNLFSMHLLKKLCMKWKKPHISPIKILIQPRLLALTVLDYLKIYPEMEKQRPQMNA